MQAAVDAIAVGQTENDVAAASYEAMTATGGEFFCNSPIVTTGYKSGLAHTTYHRRTLERGDPVAIEIGATFNRYTSPLFRTAAVERSQPRPPPHVRGLHRSPWKPPSKPSSPAPVPGMCKRRVRRSSTPAATSPTSGNAWATDSASGTRPTWGEGHIIDLKHHDERLLQPNMVFHVVPALRENGEYGVGMSETVAVTDSGHEVITNFSRELFIRG